MFILFFIVRQGLWFVLVFQCTKVSQLHDRRPTHFCFYIFTSTLRFGIFALIWSIFVFLFYKCSSDHGSYGQLVIFIYTYCTANWQKKLLHPRNFLNKAVMIINEFACSTSCFPSMVKFFILNLVWVYTDVFWPMYTVPVSFGWSWKLV